MLINHLRVAFRTITKHKGYSAINLFGLAVGMASFIIIVLYVRDELSYDRFHADADRIYRVVVDEIVAGGETSPRIGTPGAFKDAMLREIPEIEEATRVLRNGWGKTLLANADNASYYGENVLYVEDSFFDLFSFQFAQGNAQSAFDDPSSVVLTETLAKRFFSDGDALGQTLVLNGTAVQVTGVLQDIPRQSHLQFDFLASIPGKRPQWLTNWETPGRMHTYIKVRPDASMPAVDGKIQRLMDANHLGDTEAIYSTHPLSGFNGVHLSPSRDTELSPSGNQLYINVLMMVAVFILLIAGINYVNLATARSAVRTKEIGVRKVVGAMRKTLVAQFLTESILLATAAGVIAVSLVELVLPFFNVLMQKDLSIIATGSESIWGIMGLAVLMFGIAAGLYPALYLSAFRPTSIFGKHRVSGRNGLDLRRLLVISQFALSSFLLIGMFVVRSQMDYVRSASLGFDKEQVIVIPKFGVANRDRDFAARNALESLPGVVRAGGFLESIIGTREYGATDAMTLVGSGRDPVTSMSQFVDNGYVDVLGLEFTDGRNFSPNHPSDLTDGVILNETAVRQLGIQGSALGLEIVTNWGATKMIIGVVEDFHSSSLHREITPFMFHYNPAALQAVLKLSGNDIPETLKQIEQTRAEFAPDLPMDFYFLDGSVDQLYRADRDFQSVFSIMTGLTLIIACLGLFGLAAFTAEQRTKEVGVRKILGAAVTSVVGLLSKDFAKLVIVANVIAWPVAYLAMQRWLANFAYRIEMGVGVFLLAGVLALGIAMVTVGAQTLKVALANPIDALARSE